MAQVTSARRRSGSQRPLCGALWRLSHLNSPVLYSQDTSSATSAAAPGSPPQFTSSQSPHLSRATSLECDSRAHNQGQASSFSPLHHRPSTTFVGGAGLPPLWRASPCAAVPSGTPCGPLLNESGPGIKPAHRSTTTPTAALPVQYCAPLDQPPSVLGVPHLRSLGFGSVRSAAAAPTHSSFTHVPTHAHRSRVCSSVLGSSGHPFAGETSPGLSHSTPRTSLGVLGSGITSTGLTASPEAFGCTSGAGVPADVRPAASPTLHANSNHIQDTKTAAALGSGFSFNGYASEASAATASPSWLPPPLQPPVTAFPGGGVNSFVSTTTPAAPAFRARRNPRRRVNRYRGRAARGRRRAPGTGPVPDVLPAKTEPTAVPAKVKTVVCPHCCAAVPVVIKGNTYTVASGTAGQGCSRKRLSRRY